MGRRGGAEMARITPQGAGAMVLPSGFGAPAFTVNDVKESSTGCGCCKMRYENIAAFYPSILTVIDTIHVDLLLDTLYPHRSKTAHRRPCAAASICPSAGIPKHSQNTR